MSDSPSQSSAKKSPEKTPVKPPAQTKPVGAKPLVGKTVGPKPTPGKAQAAPVVAAAKSGTAVAKAVKKPKKAKPKKPQSPFRVPNLYWRLGLALVFGLLLAGGIFLVLGRLETSVADLEQKRSQLVALSGKEENYQRLKLDLASVEKQIPLLEKALPKEEETIQLLGQIRQIEEQAGVEAGSFSFSSDQPQSDQAGHHYIELVFEASGPVENLEKFTQALLDLPFLIRPKLINLAKMEEATNQMIFKAWLYVDPDFFVPRKPAD